jgi:hypothetical protein
MATQQKPRNRWGSAANEENSMSQSTVVVTTICGHTECEAGKPCTVWSKDIELAELRDAQLQMAAMTPARYGNEELVMGFRRRRTYHKSGW